MIESLPHSPACDRNKGPILGYLRTAFAAVRSVLEIGSGTGQHALHFATALGHLRWQPTDLPGNLPMLRARFAAGAPPNLLSPLALDVHELPWPVARHDARLVEVPA